MPAPVCCLVFHHASSILPFSKTFKPPWRLCWLTFILCTCQRTANYSLRIIDLSVYKLKYPFFGQVFSVQLCLQSPQLPPGKLSYFFLYDNTGVCDFTSIISESSEVLDNTAQPVFGECMINRQVAQWYLQEGVEQVLSSYSLLRSSLPSCCVPGVSVDLSAEQGR